MRDNKFSFTEYPVASGRQPIYLSHYGVRTQRVDADWLAMDPAGQACRRALIDSLWRV